MLLLALRLRLSAWVPVRIGRLPYAFALRIVQLIGSIPGWSSPPRIWARNSFRLGTLVPFLSDLDLTVWLDRPLSANQLGRLWRLLRLAKAVMPWVGEINFYIAPDMKWVARFMNEYELRRDPTLASKLSRLISTQQPSHGPLPDLPAQGAAFLLRMLDADIKLAGSLPARRTRKWRSHFEFVGRPWSWGKTGPQNLVEAVIEAALETLGLPRGAEFDQAFESLARYFGERLLSAESSQNPRIEPIWQVFFPHRFGWEAQATPIVAPRLIQLMLAQLGWEIAGLYSQPRLQNLRQHLENMQRLVSGTQIGTQGQEYREAFATLLAHRA